MFRLNSPPIKLISAPSLAGFNSTGARHVYLFSEIRKYLIIISRPPIVKDIDRFFGAAMQIKITSVPRHIRRATRAFLFLEQSHNFHGNVYIYLFSLLFLMALYKMVFYESACPFRKTKKNSLSAARTIDATKLDIRAHVRVTASVIYARISFARSCTKVR